MATLADRLRVLDAGTVPPLRSQALWHALAEAVAAGGEPTLSFVRTADPYVSVGLHRPLAEVDTERCARSGWPVYRRRAGGGSVYLDRHQLCFQLSVPAAALPASRPAALRFLLEPALRAFCAAGLDASLHPELEVVAEGRKVCGHAAAQIGSAVVFVGNLIERFDHEAASAVLHSPDAVEADELLRLMRRYVFWPDGAPVLRTDAFVEVLVSSFAEALGLTPLPGGLSGAEEELLVAEEARQSSMGWTARRRELASGPWRVKVRAGVAVCRASFPGGVLRASAVDGRFQRLRASGDLPARWSRRLCALEGAQLGRVVPLVRRWSAEDGGSTAEALAAVVEAVR